uniref:WAP domain-containing protein n=1 Tax=Periophthalmus magnuspinnatus TaxID=409849 RepID=A0A3B4B562_9GOBI
PPDCGPGLCMFLCFSDNSFKLFLVHSEKLGVCPKPRTDVDPTVVRCLSECSTDRQCEKNLKNTCGGCFFKYCSWFLRFKPGVCPEPRTDVDPTVVRCLNQCSTDSECEGNLKCCFNGCGHVCEEPRENF